jgi:hypothetical protein
MGTEYCERQESERKGQGRKSGKRNKKVGNALDSVQHASSLPAPASQPLRPTEKLFDARTVERRRPEVRETRADESDV